MMGTRGSQDVHTRRGLTGFHFGLGVLTAGHGSAQLQQGWGPLVLNPMGGCIRICPCADGW